MTEQNVTIAAESPDQAEVLALLDASDRYHKALYPAESNYLVDVESLKAAHVRFLVARAAGGKVVGCGAVLLGEDAGATTAELKRMWVNPAGRGRGLGRRILDALERVAIREGAKLMRLETGIHQPAAIGFYKASGYRERGPFGDYAEDPLSVFMEKAVTV